MMSEQDNEIMNILRRLFVKGNQNLYAKINDAVKSGDIALAYRLVHTLKSNAGQIGEVRLQEIAAAAEKMLSNGENNLTEEHSALLESELNRVLKSLEPLPENEQMPCNKTLNEKETDELFEKLDTMLKNKNPMCISLTGSLRSLPDTAELISHIENLDFTSAEEALARLRKAPTEYCNIL